MPECIFILITVSWVTPWSPRKRLSTCWVNSRRKSWLKSTTISISINLRQSTYTKLWDSTNTSKKIYQKQKQRRTPMTSWNRLQSATSTQSTSTSGSSHLVSCMSAMPMSSINFWKTTTQLWLYRVNSKISTFDSSILLDNIIIIMIRLAALVRRAVYPGVGIWLSSVRQCVDLRRKRERARLKYSLLTLLTSSRREQIQR